MVAIELTFLNGRYHATPWMRHVNEGAVEWPPSPWRLLRTLIAMWFRHGNQEDEMILKSLLSKLSENTPNYHLPQVNQFFTQHYMPQKTGTRLVFDNFITLEKQAKSFFIWEEVVLDSAERQLLDQLLSKVNYFGRAETWVEARVVEKNIEPNTFDVEKRKEDDVDLVKVLVPVNSGELFENLIRDTAELRSKGYLEPIGARWATYGVPRALFKVNPKQYAFKETTTYDVVRYCIIQKPRPRVTETLLVGDLARKAAMAQYGRLTGGQPSETLSGKNSEGVALEGHKHAYYISTDEDNDGFIDHLTIYAPIGFTATELTAFNKINVLKVPYAKWEYSVVYLGAWKKEEISNDVPIFKRSDKWVSATPFLLGRYPKYKRNGQPRLNSENIQIDGPLDQLQREIELRKTLFGVSADLIDVDKPIYRTEPPAKHKYRYRRIEKKQNGPGILCRFGLTFSEPIDGLVSLGANSHFGLGLFLPEGEI